MRPTSRPLRRHFRTRSGHGPTCRDTTDIPALGTALAGGASVLVTLDKDLLALGVFQGIAIIKPDEFWRQTTG